MRPGRGEHARARGGVPRGDAAAAGTPDHEPGAGWVVAGGRAHGGFGEKIERGERGAVRGERDGVVVARAALAPPPGGGAGHDPRVRAPHRETPVRGSRRHRATAELRRHHRRGAREHASRRRVGGKTRRAADETTPAHASRTVTNRVRIGVFVGVFSVGGVELVVGGGNGSEWKTIGAARAFVERPPRRVRGGARGESRRGGFGDDVAKRFDPTVVRHRDPGTRPDGDGDERLGGRRRRHVPHAGDGPSDARPGPGPTRTQSP